MNRPLYNAALQPRQRLGHAGLRYEKYGNFWKGQADEPLDWNLKADKDGSPKLAWVNDVTGTGYAPPQTTELLTEHHARMALLCQHQNGLPFDFKTTSRLVTGLGQDHPIENGFLWHPTLGVPYIPGSSIKGMLRNWVLVWDDKANLQRWFAKQMAGTSINGVGELIFFDALPFNVPSLQADVITPHYGPYYRDASGNTPPTDWHSPTPTPFLTVAKNQTFQFCVARRDGEVIEGNEKNLLETALSQALKTIGIGAKTAVGHGRLALSDPLADFKTLCGAFTDFKNQGKMQEKLVTALQNISAANKEAAVTYLRGKMGAEAGHYKPTLRALVFLAP